MGYCKTTLYVDAKLKQEKTFRRSHAHTHHKNLHGHGQTPAKTVMYRALLLNHARPLL